MLSEDQEPNNKEFKNDDLLSTQAKDKSSKFSCGTKNDPNKRYALLADTSGRCFINDLSFTKKTRDNTKVDHKKSAINILKGQVSKSKIPPIAKISE